MSQALTNDTRPFLSGGGAMGERIRAHDWASTPLGPPEGWPEVLRSALRICLSSAFPTAIYWGPDLVLLYNDSWAAIPAERHPGCLGQPCREVWSDIWEIIAPQFAGVMDTGEGFSAFDQMLPMVRDGVPEETYWDYSFTALIDGTGRVRGVLNQGRERTAQVRSDRRQQFRLDLEEALRGLSDSAAIVAAATRALGRHLGADRVGFGEMQPDDATVFLLTDHATGLPALGGHFNLDDFGPEAVARQRAGLTLWSADVTAERLYDVRTWEAVGTRAFVSVPLVREGRLRAVLYVNQAQPRRWTADEIALIEAVAARVWDAIERLAAESALRTSEAKLRTVLDTLPVGVLIAEAPSGRIVGQNTRAEAILGHGVLPSAPGEGPPRWVGFHEDGRRVQPAEWPLIKVIRDGQVQAELEVDYQRGDGRRSWIGFAGAPMRAQDGSVAGGVVVLSDIDARKRSEHLLTAAKLAAEEANLAKSTFIANMSHELRTPLSAIIGYSEMMIEEVQDGAQPGELSGDIRKIEGSARHLLGLINDVLDLSKVESGKMEVYAESFEIEAVVHDIAATVAGLVSKKNNRLQLDLAPGLGIMEQDLTKVRQILLNLLGNAAKFTEKGIITLKVSADREDGLAFRVSDTGIGMSPEQLSRLFQRFQQADSSTTRRFGGTGLGLALTKAFADLLGGIVEVESLPGEGSAFTVILPRRYVAPVASEEAMEAETRPAADRRSGRDLVLIIDDDDDQRALMARFLQREGFRSRSAGDGETGLRLARELQPRAILLDVMMPGIDGWSVLSALKADPDLVRIPVVMVTFVDQRGLAASLGAADYVLKPVRWEKFKAVMDRFRPTEGSVLVIDDDPDTRARVRALLERDGWKVVEAGDGREGLERFEEARPDVVLLDLMMPVMDGFTFFETMRGRSEGSHVPVVVLTARDLSREDRRRLAGANQILNKGDVNLHELARRLEQLAEPAAS